MLRLRNKLKNLIAVAVVAVTITSANLGLNSLKVNAASKNHLINRNNEIVSMKDSNDYELASNAHDGTILHAWNWSFNTIKNNMRDIAEAGYTSVQVSPIQGTKENSMDTGSWWLLYQPTNFRIGNAQLGTREEFRNMCSEAHRYGIKVIVDVVANHTANAGGGDLQYRPSNTVDPDILNDPNCWHEFKPVINWDDRWKVTHLSIGEPDLNTSNPKIQNKVIDFLNDAIDCGADGFRFDAAKHIELPTDPGASNFWPNVLSSLKNRDKLFIYGEVLQGNADAYTSYPEYINLTTSKYGEHVRAAVGFGSGKNVGDTKDYISWGVNADRLITWVESHDTYCDKNNISTGMNKWQIKMGWALIASRAYTTPLYFDRPDGYGKFPGNMGNMGNSDWKDPDVVAINKFHNKMEGTGEYLDQQGNEILLIGREDKGAVIVNLGDRTNADLKIKFRDGQYKNYGSAGGEVTVSGGRVTGELKPGITILYANNIYKPEVSSSQENCDFVGSMNVTLNVKNADTAVYSINGGNERSFTDGKVINIGSDMENGQSCTLYMKAQNSAGSAEKTYVYNKVDKIKSSKVYFYNTDNYANPKVYIYNDNVNPVKEIKSWPGVDMNKESDGVYSYTLPENFKDAKVIFNDGGNNQVPDKQKPGFELKNGACMEYKDHNWQVHKDKVKPVVSISKEGGEFYDSLKLTLGVSNAENATYQIDDQSPVKYKDGDAITIGKDSPEGSEIRVRLCVSNGNGTDSKEFTFKKMKRNEKSSKVYFYNSLNYSNPTVYIYDDSLDPVKEIKQWPGISMKNEGNNLYSYTLPSGFKNAKVIFSDNGQNQVPDRNKPGFNLENGSIMEYIDGQWIEYNKSQNQTKVYCEKPNNWGDLKIYVYSEQNGKVKEIKKWPGVNMVKENNNLYSYVIPESYKNAKVIFTDGNNQMPGLEQQGLSITKGKIMIHKNDGSWTEYK